MCGMMLKMFNIVPKMCGMVEKMCGMVPKMYLMVPTVIFRTNPVSQSVPTDQPTD